MPGYLLRSAHRRAWSASAAARAAATPAAAQAQARDGGHFETALFETYRDRRVPLEIVCFDGIVVHGYLRAWERYSFLVDTPEGEVMVMKHGVIRLGPRPARAGRVAGAVPRVVVDDA
jgi:sRNA-binding regulator protein Hfq